MKIIFLSINNFFGQAMYPWETLNLKRIQHYLELENWTVEIVDMQEIANSSIKIENEIIFYTSSQKPEVKVFIDDIITILSKRNKLIPEYELFRCHDNKGFQELFKRERNIEGLKSWYYSQPNKINFNEIDYPIVIKKADGASGTGVWLVKNKEQFTNVLNKFYHSPNWIAEFELKGRAFVNTFIRKKSDWTITKNWFSYLKNQRQKRAILQQFVPGLEFDFKVLVFFDRFYVLKRFVRTSDFRASGSGNFEWTNSPDHDLLDFSLEIFTKLSTPFASLDICSKDGLFYLIEFQVPHMGPVTLLDSEGYFSRTNGYWNFEETKSDLEKSYAYSIYNFIKEKYA